MTLSTIDFEMEGITVNGSTNSLAKKRLLDPGYELTLRPMHYPQLYNMYLDSIKNTWNVSEIDFTSDITDLRLSLSPAEKHMVNRLVAFFATGDSIVANNLVLSLYKHLNSPEARMFLSRQLFEEALHVQFYLTLLDSYIPDVKEREESFAAIKNIPSIRSKADFCFKWIDTLSKIDQCDTAAKKQQFLLNLICFAACIEGLFFFGAFAYVFFLRSKGYLDGLAAGTNWVFRDESAHMNFAFEVVNIVRSEEPYLFDEYLEKQVVNMIKEAVDCETQFAEDLLGQGIPGMSLKDTRLYLEFIADQRLLQLGLGKQFNTKNPFSFTELQDVQEVTNFFERKVAAYQVGISGNVSFDEDF